MPRFGGSASRGFGTSGGFPGGRGSAVAILEYAAQERVMAQYLYEHAGAPTDGTNGTYANVALPGALLIDTDAKTLYQNTGTQASPTWTERSANGGGSGVLYQVQCFDQALPMGVQVNLSLDPTDTNHVAELVNDGYSLNAGKDAFVVPETGDYLLSLWAQFAQHATQWGLFEVQDSTGACYFQAPIPPVSLVDFGGQQPAFASSGVLRVPLVNVSGVPILVRSRLQTAAVGLLQLQVKRLDDVPA